MWFNGWDELVRVVMSGVVSFAALLAAIRLGGNRTLSNMNASDFIVTVAIGTTFATTMLSPSVTISAGLTALALLIGIQWLTVWLSVKYPRLRRHAEGDAIVLLRNGVPQEATMERQRVSWDELRQAVRHEGHGTFDGLALVLLEANGRFSVIPRERIGNDSALPPSS